MFTENYEKSLKISTNRGTDHKLSLKTRMKSTKLTQSITTWNSNYQRNKLSLKEIQEKDIKVYGINSIKLNIKYDNIFQHKHKQQYQQQNSKFSIHQFFCKITNQSAKICCQNQHRCIWIKKWNKNELNSNQISCYQKQQINLFKIPQQILTQIDKDINRTQPKCNFFKNQFSLNNLRSTLIGYYLIDPQLGYVQGMNIIASIFVYHSKSINQSVKAMSMFMKQSNFRVIYLNDLSIAQRHSSQIVNLLKNKSFNLYNHIVQKHKIDLSIFIIGWLFSLLGSFVPIEHMHLIIDAYIQRSWKGIYSIIICLLIYLSQQVLNKNDQTEIMSILSTQQLSNTNINWAIIIKSSQQIPIGTNQIVNIY